MKKLFTILLSILIIIGSVGCSKLSLGNQPQIEIHETIECVDVIFTASLQKISINNDGSIFNISGTSDELKNWLNSIETGEDIVYVSYNKSINEPTYILAKKYHYYTGDRNFTWMISDKMIKQGIYYLDNFSN